MRKIIFPLLAVFALSACHRPQTDIAEAIRRIVEQHPQTTLQDIYKSFYQDRFGAEHMISDTAAVREYLLYELAVSAADTMPNPYYEPVGAHGRYMRVYLRCVNEGLLTAEQLSDAFIRSARPSEQPQQSWAEEWTEIEQTAQQVGVAFTDEDSRFFRQAADSLWAVHHSDAYRNAYHPHYRIVERTIFENELKHLIEQ